MKTEDAIRKVKHIIQVNENYHNVTAEKMLAVALEKIMALEKEVKELKEGYSA